MKNIKQSQYTELTTAQLLSVEGGSFKKTVDTIRAIFRLLTSSGRPQLT